MRISLFLLVLLGAGVAWLHSSALSEPEKGDRFSREAILASLASETTVYADDGKSPLGSFFDATHRRYVQFDEMPPELVEAIVAAEDARFFKHYGVDPLGIARALFSNIKARRVTAGGSTLTQQTAKNLFGRSDRSYSAKWREFKDALLLERYYSKKEILEFYLNQFHVAGNGRGVGIAAKHFFDRNLDQLNTKELAFIAGSVKGPQLYDPHSQKNDSLKQLALERAELRTGYVLRRMRETGALTAAEETKAKKSVLRFKQGQFRGQTDRILQQVLLRMESPWMQAQLQKAGIDDWSTEGLQIITTINSALQPQLQKMVDDTLTAKEKWLGWNGSGDKRVEGALLIFKEGEVVASVGGRDAEGFDRAWEAKRLFGSVWKPLVLAHALELGWDEEALIENQDNMIEEGRSFYWPRPDHQKRGEQVTLRWMAVKSENIAAVRLLERLLDPLDDNRVARLAEKFDLAQHPAELNDDYRRRLDGLGIVLNQRAEEEIRFARAQLTLYREMVRQGRLEAARDLRRLSLGGAAYRREVARVEKRERTTLFDKRSGHFEALQKQLQKLAITPENEQFICQSSGAIRLKSSSPSKDSTGFACQWDEIPAAERPLISIWNNLTIADLQQLQNEMGEPLPPAERILPENLYYLPVFRNALARRSFVEFCNRIGIEETLPLVASLPLGSAAISLAELNRAYQTIMTGKRYRTQDPESSELLIREIRLHNGTSILHNGVESQTVLSEEIAAKMRSILQGVVRHGTGRRADLALTVPDGAGGRLKLPVAGKTGTTNNSRTVGFAGGMAAPATSGVFRYNNGWTIGSWAGADRNQPLRGPRGGLSGATGALPLWIGAAEAISKQENLAEKIDKLDLYQQMTGRVSADVGIASYSATVDPMSGRPMVGSTAIETELTGDQRHSFEPPQSTGLSLNKMVQSEEPTSSLGTAKQANAPIDEMPLPDFSQSRRE